MRKTNFKLNSLLLALALFPTIALALPQAVKVTLYLADASGKAITLVKKGTPFQILAKIKDLGVKGNGVYSTYFTIPLAAKDGITFGGSVTPGYRFTALPLASISSAGVEAGGSSDSVSASGKGSELEVFRVQATATKNGAFTLTPTPPTSAPRYPTTLFGVNTAVSAPEIKFEPLTIIVVP